DGDHGVTGIPAFDGRQRVLEGRACGRLEVREHLFAGEMRIGTRLALVGDAQRGALALARGGALGFGTRLGGDRRRFYFSLGHDGGMGTGSTGAAAASWASARRASSRSCGVLTPSGIVSTSAISMRMPSSSALSCSRLSRSSRLEGGSETKRSSAD